MRAMKSKIRPFPRWGDPESKQDSIRRPRKSVIDDRRASTLTATQPATPAQAQHEPTKSLDHAVWLRERFQPAGQVKAIESSPGLPEQDGISFSPTRASLSAPDCRRASSSTPSQQVLPLQLLSPRPSTHRNGIPIVQRHDCLAKQCQEATHDQRGRQYQQATSSPQDSSASLPGLPTFSPWTRKKYHDT